MLKFFPLFLAACVFLSSPLHANTSGAQQVVIQERMKDNVPDFIRMQMELIARDCSGSADNVYLIKPYRYTSLRTREEGVSTDYFIDLSGLKQRAKPSCILGRICDDEGECAIVGYAANGYMQWEQSFVQRAARWEQVVFDGDPALTGFGFITAHDCPKDEDGEDVASCRKSYLWLGNKLTPYDPEATARKEAAAAAAAAAAAEAAQNAPAAEQHAPQPEAPALVPGQGFDPNSLKR